MFSNKKCSARVSPPLSRPTSTLTSYLLVAPSKKICDNRTSFSCFQIKQQDKRNTQLKGKLALLTRHKEPNGCGEVKYCVRRMWGGTNMSFSHAKRAFSAGIHK